MANKVTIDVEGRFVDNMSDEAKAAAENVEDIGDAAKKAKKETEKLNKTKAKPTVDAEDSKFLKKIRAAEDKARKFGHTKTAAVLNAIDKASAIMNKVSNKAKGIAGKTWQGIVKAKDSASAILKNVSSLGKQIAGKTWTAAVKIKDTFTTPLKKLKDMLFNIKTLIGGIAAAWAATKLVANPINVADAYSSAKISFSTLLGDSQGQQMMDDLDQFARATPFNTTNVIGNAQKMLAMGWDAEDIITDMEVIGNAAAATGKLDTGLESIVRALSQIKTKGKLSTEELNQLAEAGISAKAMLAEQLGYGTGDEGIAAMTEDLEAGAIASDKAITALLEGMKKYDGMMESMANETVEGLWSQMQDTFNINIVRKWGQGLQDGAKKGFGTILDLLDSSEDALSDLGDTLYEVGKTASNWVADRLENAVKRIKDITGSEEFQKADMTGKIKLLWSGVIANPFSKWWDETVVPWWEGTAVPWLAEKAKGIGKVLGSGLTAGITTLLGIDATSALEEGVSIGGSFMEGFLEGFDTDKIGKALSDWVSNNKGLATALGAVLGAKLIIGIGNFVGSIKTLFGGKGTGTGTGLGDYATATMNVTAGVVNINGGLGNNASDVVDTVTDVADTAGDAMGRSGKTTWIGSLFGKKALTGGAGKKLLTGGTTSGTPLLTGGTTAGAAGTAAKGLTSSGSWLSKLLTLGSKSSVIGADGTLVAVQGGLGGTLSSIGGALGSTATTAAGTAAAGLAGGTGIIGSILGLGSAAIDLFQGIGKSKEGDKKGAKDEYWKAGTKTGMVATGAGIGAAIGSVVPGVGTAIGAAVGGGIGGVAALATGNKAGKSLSDASDEGGWLSNAWDATKGFFTETIPAAWNSMTESLSGFFTETLPEAWNGLWSSVGSFFTETIPSAWNTLSEKVSTFFSETLPEAWNSFWSAIGNFFTETVPYALGYATGKVITFFSETLPDAWDRFWAAVGGFFVGIGQWAVGLWNDYVVPFFTETIPTAWNSFWGAIGTFFTDTLPTWAAGIWNDYIVPFFTETLPEKWDAFWAAIGAFFTETLPAWAEDTWNNHIVPFFTESIPQWFGDLWTSIKEFFTETLPTWAENIWNNHVVPFFTETIPQWVSDVWDSIKEFFADAKDGFVENIWAPISTFFTETIPGWVSGVWDKVTGWFNEVKDNFLSGLKDGSGGGGGGKKARGGIVGGGSSSLEAFARGGIAGYSNGGMVRGGAKLITVAEEGNPEMIIPLGSQRRDRALKLWAKTGHMLGVDKFARGGRTNGREEGLFFDRSDSNETVGGQYVQIDVGGITVEIHVDAANPESVADQIKKQANEIAETMAGVIADALAGQFANTPLKGGAV